MSGSVTSSGVVTQAVTNSQGHALTMTVERPAQPLQIQTRAGAPDAVTGRQRVDVSVSSYGFFGSDNGQVESNGSAVRGAAVNSADTWATFSNTPGSRLDASLGAPSLQHSYMGVGSLGRRAGGTSGRFYSYAYGLFGGRSTTDMPTTGRAEYQGGFEGLEQVAFNGAPMQTMSISGRANLTADFAARTVRGRIDDVSNHGMGPIKTPAGYSIGYNGAITGSSFAGTSWLTQANSDAPLNGFAQNTGALHGGFFGPGAAETAGALGVSAADAQKSMLVTGAFGAAKR